MLSAKRVLQSRIRVPVDELAFLRLKHRSILQQHHGHTRRPVDFRKGRLNEPANAGDASRATIWQGNCHVEDRELPGNVRNIVYTI